MTADSHAPKDVPADPTPRDPRHPVGPGEAGPTRWIETREGGLFFVNALFLFPYLMVLVPLGTRVFVRGVMGGMPEPSVIVDTFPVLAEHLLPRLGWLAALPGWLAWKNLSLERRTFPRVALGVLLALHLVTVAWTVTAWLGLHEGVLPGGALSGGVQG
jgi:hypothetical protein